MHGNESGLIQRVPRFYPGVSDHIGNGDQRGVGGRVLVDVAPTLPRGLARHSELDGNLRPGLAMSSGDSDRLQLCMFQRTAHCSDVRQCDQRAITVARTIRMTTQPIPRLPTFNPSVAERHGVRLP